MAANWPGQLSYDSVVQLAEGRSARYGNWHPPVMSWLLGLFDVVVPGAGLFFLFDAALLFGGLALAFSLGRRAGWASLLTALVLVLTPQFLLYAGDVWKDVLFSASAVLGFMVLAWAAGRARRGEQIAALSAAILLLSLSVLARQNGFLILPFAAIAVGAIVFQRTGRPTSLQAIAWGACWLFTALFVYASASLILGTRIVGRSGPLEQFRLLATYDLAGALHDDPHLPLPRLQNNDPEFEALMRSDAARLYTPERNDTLARSRAAWRGSLREIGRASCRERV